MTQPTLPLVILGGSDRKAAELPAGVDDKHPIVGVKGVDLRIAGRPLIDLLLERVAASGYFGPIFIAGPISAFGQYRGPAEVIDTDGSFGENIARATSAVRGRGFGGPVGYMTCDILPDPDELRLAMEKYLSHGPIDFWFPIIIAPDDPSRLGASAWKPRYRIHPTDGGPLVTILPSHLLIADPGAIRLPLVYRGFEVAYRSRNRNLLYRLVLMVRAVLAEIVLKDLVALLRGRRPTMIAGVIVNGIALGRRLQAKVIGQDELAQRLTRMYIRRRHRLRHPERLGRFDMIDALSLAKDVDTEEEAEEMNRELEAGLA